MSSGANGRIDVLSRGEANYGDYVLGSGASGDDRRSTVDHPVPEASGGVVAVGTWRQELATKLGLETVDVHDRLPHVGLIVAIGSERVGELGEYRKTRSAHSVLANSEPSHLTRHRQGPTLPPVRYGTRRQTSVT